MSSPSPRFPRRRFLGGLALGATLFHVKGAFADELTLTPRQTEGPFYPDHLPLDTDNDLLVVNDDLTPAVGDVTHLSGRILGQNGEPLRNALVEIWQVDNQGIYLHTGSPNHEKRDTGFQGFGRFLTGSTGEYYFRTIKPVAYAVGGNVQRAPHIHVIVKQGDKRLLTTQLYVKGDPQNDRDGVLRGVRDRAARESVLVDFTPLPDSRIGELAARFDIVVGSTPEETGEDRQRGLDGRRTFGQPGR